MTDARRRGRPGVIVGAVAFLALPTPMYVHGHLPAVDDGWMAR